MYSCVYLFIYTSKDELVFISRKKNAKNSENQSPKESNHREYSLVHSNANKNNTDNDSKP